MNSHAPEDPAPEDRFEAAEAVVRLRPASALPVKHRPHDLTRAPGMRRQPSARTDRAGVSLVQLLVTRDLKWAFREQSVEDFGIDAQMEVITNDTPVTGRLIALQIKSGPSHFKEIQRSKSEPGWNFYANNDHLAYWLQHSLPVIVVIDDPDTGSAFFQVVRQDLIVETEKGFNLFIPDANCFDATAREAILDFVTGWRDLEASLDTTLTLLPPNCASVITRAAEIDRPNAARLAQALATGRSAPEFTANALVAAQPSWILTSPVEQDLWIALGNYANAHGFERIAADAFWLASESEGERTARALAVTGLCLLQFKRKVALPFLEEARRQGQVLLADVGLAAVDTPMDDARALDVPQSMIDATEEELDAEPTVLNFSPRWPCATATTPLRSPTASAHSLAVARSLSPR